MIFILLAFDLNIPSSILQNVCNFLAVGSYARAIPYSPELPAGCKIDNVIAIPQEPTKTSSVNWFLCDNEAELKLVYLYYCIFILS